MPVSGLIITTDPQQPERARQAQAAIVAHPCITWGPSRGHRHAAVAETRDAQHDEQLFGWIKQLPGVVFLDVVFADFSDAEASACPQAGRVGGSWVASPD